MEPWAFRPGLLRLVTPRLPGSVHPVQFWNALLGLYGEIFDSRCDRAGARAADTPGAEPRRDASWPDRDRAAVRTYRHRERHSRLVPRVLCRRFGGAFARAAVGG